jgi:DNA-damage-inducible protein J
MMSRVTVQARIDPELKAEAEAVFSAIGLSTAEAIRVFLQQAVNSGGLPFQPSAKKANVETLAAMQELEAHGGQTFQSTEELFTDWKR